MSGESMEIRQPSPNLGGKNMLLKFWVTAFSSHSIMGRHVDFITLSVCDQTPCLAELGTSFSRSPERLD